MHWPAKAELCTPNDVLPWRSLPKWLMWPVDLQGHAGSHEVRAECVTPVASHTWWAKKTFFWNERCSDHELEQKKNLRGTQRVPSRCSEATAHTLQQVVLLTRVKWGRIPGCWQICIWIITIVVQAACSAGGQTPRALASGYILTLLVQRRARRLRMLSCPFELFTYLSTVSL